MLEHWDGRRVERLIHQFWRQFRRSPAAQVSDERNSPRDLSPIGQCPERRLRPADGFPRGLSAAPALGFATLDFLDISRCLRACAGVEPTGRVLPGLPKRLLQ